MRLLNSSKIITLIVVLVSSCTEEKLNYPTTKRDCVADTFWGNVVQDCYRWLESDTSTETKEWVTLQEKFTEQYFRKLPLRDSFQKELSRYYNFPRKSSYYVHHGKYFSFRNNGLQNQSVLGMQQTEIDANYQVVIDPNVLSKDGNVALNGWKISADGKYIAYQLSENGSDWNSIFVKDIITSQELADTLFNVKFSGIAWYKNGFFYSRYPKRSGAFGQDQFQSVYYHIIGQPQSSDKLIFQNPTAPLESVTAQTTPDEDWLILYRSAGTKGNALYFRKTQGTEPFQAIDTSQTYDYGVVGVVGNELIIHTNYQAPSYRLLKVPVNQPDKRIELLPESKHLLQGAWWNNRYLATHHLVDATSRLTIRDSAGKEIATVPLPTLGTVSDISLPQDSTHLYFAFSSFLHPASIYRYDIESRRVTLIYRPPSILNPDSFETRQVRYKSTDGVEVPMFIVHKRGIQLDGKHDCLLYGYGGFNISLLPDYSVMRAVWLNNGGIFALPSLRGGGEFGENWHEAGMLDKKQQVFDDFITAAEFLIASGYTNSQQLVISGRSNGGLLVAACLTQRPDLYKVALPAVGVLDMLRFHRFTIGWAWMSEYGSSQDSVQFRYLYRYSPLHNVKMGTRYPATLITTGDHDDRVAPAHSFKFTAEMQRCQSGSNPILIRIDRSAGHGSGKPVQKRILEEADVLAFIYRQLRY